MTPDTAAAVWLTLMTALIAIPLYAAFRPDSDPSAAWRWMQWHGAGLAWQAQRSIATLAEIWTDLRAADEHVGATEDTSWLAEADHPEVGSQPKCPRCHGRRCKPYRDGLDCGPQRAPSLVTSLSAGGRHERAYRRPVPPWWSPLPTAVRRSLAPTAWAARLGVPAVRLP